MKSCDEDSDEVMLMDHGASLFGTKVTSFRQYDSTICLDNNDLAVELRSFLGFDQAIERLLQIPEWYVRKAVGDVDRLSVSAKEIQELADFLLARRKQLRTMFHQTQKDTTIFPRIAPGQLFPIKGEPDDYIEYHI